MFVQLSLLDYTRLGALARNQHPRQLEAQLAEDLIHEGLDRAEARSNNK